MLREIELGLVPRTRPPIVAVMVALLLATCFLAQLWSSTARQISGGLVIGAVSLGLQRIALTHMPKTRAGPSRSSCLPPVGRVRT